MREGKTTMSVGIVWPTECVYDPRDPQKTRSDDIGTPRHDFHVE